MRLCLWAEGHRSSRSSLSSHWDNEQNAFKLQECNLSSFGQNDARTGGFKKRTVTVTAFLGKAPLG